MQSMPHSTGGLLYVTLPFVLPCHITPLSLFSMILHVTLFIAPLSYLEHTLFQSLLTPHIALLSRPKSSLPNTSLQIDGHEHGGTVLLSGLSNCRLETTQGILSESLSPASQITTTPLHTNSQITTTSLHYHIKPKN